MIGNEESIVSQLAEVTATSLDGEHLVLVDEVTIILPDMQGSIASAIEASAYLYVGEWGATHPCSDHTDCVLWSHVCDLAPVSDPPVTVESDEDEDTLVRKASRPSLASLYKRARQTGLVAPSPSGYF
jgi:hypothetical protein